MANQDPKRQIPSTKVDISRQEALRRVERAMDRIVNGEIIIKMQGGSPSGSTSTKGSGWGESLACCCKERRSNVPEPLVLYALEVRFDLKDKIDLASAGQTAALEKKLLSVYSTCTRDRGAGSLFLSSETTDTWLFISQDVVCFRRGAEKPLGEAVNQVVHELQVIRDSLGLDGAARITVDGMFRYRSKTSLADSGLVRWSPETAALLGEGQIDLGWMMAVRSGRGATMISITNVGTKDDEVMVQFTRSGDASISDAVAYLEMYCSDVSAKALVILEKSF